MSLRIAIVGGGFSGLTVAANICLHAKIPVQIYLIEMAAKFAQGIAYSTTNAQHLLNVRAKEMSAFDNDADSFVNWLKTSSSEGEVSKLTQAEEFYSRELYGKYLQDILQNISATDNVDVQLITDTAIDVVENSNLTLLLESGRSLPVDKLVLAHGHITPDWQVPSDQSIPVIKNPWQFADYQQITKNAPVLIVGTGLTMVDAMLQLKSQQHQGEIYALSRHGLMPVAHENTPGEYHFSESIKAMKVRQLFNYIRQEHNRLAASGAGRQCLFRALRMRANMIWDEWDISEKKRFLRHVSPYWDRQRHRIAPEIANIIAQNIHEKTLHILAGRLLEIKQSKVIILPRSSRSLKELDVSYIINCSGPGRYSQTRINPLIDALMRKGMVMSNELQLGLLANAQGAIIDQKLQISKNVFTLGPPLKGLFFESTAVKEIARQSYHLSQLLLSNL